MQFSTRKRDWTQWHQYFAYTPTKVAESDGHAEYVWLDYYESRLVKASSMGYWWHFENRRIGSQVSAITTVYSD